MMKQFQKTCGIPFGPLHHSMQPMEWGPPAKEIQSFLMLTSCVNIGLTPLFRPHPTQLRMKRESRLIFKKDHSSSCASFHLLEFFLTLPETSPPLPQKLEQIDTPVASANSPASESTAGHAELVSLSDETASGTQRELLHPIARGESQNASAISIKPRPTPCSTVHRTRKH